MTFIEIAKPTGFERLVVLVAQWIFYVGFFLLYLVSSRTAHRMVGYFEEEAVLSYTLYLAEIDAGRSPNVPAPAIAKQYWKLADDAMLRDVVLVVRADEAHHRDTSTMNLRTSLPVSLPIMRMWMWMSHRIRAMPKPVGWIFDTASHHVVSDRTGGQVEPRPEQPPETNRSWCGWQCYSVR